MAFGRKWKEEITIFFIEARTVVQLFFLLRCDPEFEELNCSKVFNLVWKRQLNRLCHYFVIKYYSIQQLLLGVCTIPKMYLQMEWHKI
jgi:hypothetical protein